MSAATSPGIFVRIKFKSVAEHLSKFNLTASRSFLIENVHPPDRNPQHCRSIFQILAANKFPDPSSIFSHPPRDSFQRNHLSPDSQKSEYITFSSYFVARVTNVKNHRGNNEISSRSFSFYLFWKHERETRSNLPGIVTGSFGPRGLYRSFDGL